MKEKNRFSTLLENLMDTCDIKNYTLAQELQYDVSYISKWVSGRMLPSTKNDKNVIHGISHCITAYGSEEGLQQLLKNYQTASLEELELAIFDNLMAEYNYVRDTERDTGNVITQKTAFYPKLDMQQYIAKMHHPVLRRINSLDIVAAIDILSMEREYRLQITNIDNPNIPGQWHYPNVHFSLIINLKHLQWNYIHDIIFLINMLINMSHVDFHLYGSTQAHGRAMFSVKEDFSISGMLIDRNQCLSVTVSEDPVHCDTLYHYMQSLCTRDHLLIRRFSMAEMLQDTSYARSLLSPNQRLIIGHFTEHFLTDELFEDIIQIITQSETQVISIEKLRWYHAMTKQSIEHFPSRIIFYKTAFSEFALTGTVDFYGYPVTLSAKQRLQYIRHLRECILNNTLVTTKLIYGRLISDFHYSPNFSVFTSDALTCLRLENQKHMYLVHHADLKNAFQNFYEEVWNYSSTVVLSDHDEILGYIDHTIQQIQIIEELDHLS